MLFSATQTTKVEDLARISLRAGPLYINVDNTKEHSTVEGLEQGYVICEPDSRFLLLFSFLKRQRSKKCIVFFSSCNCVKCMTYHLARCGSSTECSLPTDHSELLNYIDLPVYASPFRTSSTQTDTTVVWISTGNKSRSSERTPSSNSGEEYNSYVLLPTN